MNRTPLTRAIPPTTTQAAEGPGVVWHEGRPWCAQCSTSLGAAVIVAGHVASDVRPDRVPVCPVCP